jgi:hypothetical protein
VTLIPTRNPILAGETVKNVDIERLESPVVLGRLKRSAKRDLRDARRRKTALATIEGLTHDLELVGFTKGQFSLLDMILACLEITGPAAVTISTWTAARHEIQTLAEARASGKIHRIRFFLDFTLARRDPEAAHAIRQKFGQDTVRIAQNHSKFALFENDSWNLVLRTSMNLNMNPRFEDFTLAHDPPLMEFLNAILDEIWSKQPTSLQDERPKTIRRHFLDEM